MKNNYHVSKIVGKYGNKIENIMTQMLLPTLGFEPEFGFMSERKFSKYQERFRDI